MRLPIVPAWFPLRALALQGVMALCVLLFCLAPLWYVTWKLEADIKGLETRIQVQETLQPLMEGLNARREETRRLLGATKTLPTPDTLPLIVTSLQKMVSLSGMQSSHFVPAAETVVEKNRIRLDGTPFRPSRQFPAPCPPAERTAVAFRHGIFERHPFRRASRILAGDLGHVHATGQHAAALMKG